MIQHLAFTTVLRTTTGESSAVVEVGYDELIIPNVRIRFWHERQEGIVPVTGYELTLPGGLRVTDQDGLANAIRWCVEELHAESGEAFWPSSDPTFVRTGGKPGDWQLVPTGGVGYLEA